MSLLRFEDVGLRYRKGSELVTALEHIDLTVEVGEFVAIVGPSGCGKSSLLKLAAGVLRPSAGGVYFRGKPVTGFERSRVMMFQDSLLYPWMTVEENVGFGLKLAGVPKEERNDIVRRYLELTGLTDFAASPPYELSGGMKQRTSLARTLACNPELVLMDEPFASLDALTKRGLQEFLLSLWRDLGKTFLLVTHDIDEAVRLGTRILVMSQRPGTIVDDLSAHQYRDRDKKALEESIYRMLSLSKR